MIKRKFLTVAVILVAACMFAFAGCEVRTNMPQVSSMTVSGEVVGKMEDDTLSLADLGDVVISVSYTSGKVTEIPLAHITELPEGLTAEGLGVKLVAGDNTVTFTYKEEDKTVSATFTVVAAAYPVYTLSFDTLGGSVVASISVPARENPVKPADPTKQGYTFVRWVNGEEEFTFDSLISEDITLKAVWEANTDTAYSTEYYIENPEGGYTLYAKESAQGVTDSEVSAKLKEIAHYVHDVANEASTLSGKIAADGSLTLKVYYALERFTVTVKVSGSEDKVIAGVKYGSTLADVYGEAPALTGYTFGGWYNGELKLEGNETVSSDVTVEAKFSANKYTITYYETVSNTITSEQVTFGEEVTLKNVSPISYGAFDGWYNGEERVSDGKWNIASDIALVSRYDWNVYDFNNGENNLFYMCLRSGKTEYKRTIEVADSPIAANGKAIKVVTENQDYSNTAILIEYLDAIFSDSRVTGLALEFYVGAKANNDSLDIRFSTKSNQADTNYRFTNFPANATTTVVYTREMYSVMSTIKQNGYVSFFFNRYTDTFYIDNVRPVYENDVIEINLNGGSVLNANKGDTVPSAYGLSNVKSVAYADNGTIMYAANDGTDYTLETVTAESDIPAELKELLNGGSALKVTNHVFSSFNLSVSGDVLKYYRASGNLKGFAFDVYTVIEKTGYKSACKGESLGEGETLDTSKPVYDSNGNPVMKTYNNELSQVYYVVDKKGEIIVDAAPVRYVNVDGKVIDYANVQGAKENFPKGGYVLTNGLSTLTVSLEDILNGNMSKSPAYFRFLRLTNLGEYYVFNLRPVYDEEITVSFDAKGGTEVASQHIAHNGKLDLSAIKTERAGYTFAGWYYGETEMTEEALASITMGRSLTLTAHWTANTYTLSFDGTEETSAVSYDGKVGTLPELPAKEGYTVMWQIDGSELKSGDVWKYTSDKTAVIVYVANEYSLTIEYVCGETSVKESSVVKVAYDGKYTITAPEITGYTLAEGQVLECVMDTVGGKTIKLNYNANVYTLDVYCVFGSEDITPDDFALTIQFTYGQPIVLPKAPEIETYNFNKWQLVMGSETITLVEGEIWTYTAYAEVEAVYKQTATLVIHFYKQGTTTKVCKDFEKEYEAGTVTDVITLPEVEGYVIASAGDYSVSDGKITLNEVLTISGKEIAVYYQPVSYEILFNADGGTASVNAMTVTYGEEYQITATAQKENYFRFLGWFDANGVKVTEGTWLTADSSTLTARYDNVIEDFENGTQTFVGTYTRGSNPNSARTLSIVADPTNGNNNVLMIETAAGCVEYGTVALLKETLDAVFANHNVASFSYNVYAPVGSALDFQFSDIKGVKQTYNELKDYTSATPSQPVQTVIAGKWITYNYTRAMYNYHSTLINKDGYMSWFSNRTSNSTLYTFYMDNFKVVYESEADLETRLFGIKNNTKYPNGIKVETVTLASDATYTADTRVREGYKALLFTLDKNDADTVHDYCFITADKSVLDSLFADPTVEAITFNLFTVSYGITLNKSNEVVNGTDLDIRTKNTSFAKDDGSNYECQYGNTEGLNTWVTYTFTRDFYNRIKATTNVFDFIKVRHDGAQFYIDNVQVLKSSL